MFPAPSWTATPGVESCAVASSCQDGSQECCRRPFTLCPSNMDNRSCILGIPQRCGQSAHPGLQSFGG